MMATSNRLTVATIALAIWVAITVSVGLWQVGPDTPLDKFASEQFVWGTPLAAAFMLLVAWAMGWRDLGFKAASPSKSWWLIWLPVLMILGFAATIVLLGRSIPISVFLIVTVNTLIVGFSEELAFRGVVWGAARRALPFWGAFLLVTFLFGLVHVLNALMTGQFAEAGVQAFNAMLSGAVFLALRIRTRSLIPVIVVHWLWDLAVFSVGVSSKGSAADADAVASQASGGLMTMLTGGLLIAGPLAVYGLFLIRNAAVREGWQDDNCENIALNHQSKGV